jgi:hypothetical protein
MKKLLVAALLLTGCITDPVMLQKARTRYVEEGYLRNCLRSAYILHANSFRSLQCIQESRQRCLQERLEPDCGMGIVYTETMWWGYGGHP